MATQLETLLAAVPEWALLTPDADAAARQAVLDKIGPAFCEKLPDDVLREHIVSSYENSAQAYAQNPGHEHVTKALCDFMERPEIPDGGRIRELGCGHGAGALFMADPDPEFRKSLMGRVHGDKTLAELRDPPTKAFCVVATDMSPAMEEIARKAIQRHFLLGDTGALERSPGCMVEREDMHDLSKVEDASHDGVYSSAALLLHTPPALVRPAIEGVARILRPGGLFGVSYSPGDRRSYHALLWSRQGRVKYFSHPPSKLVITEAKRVGLLLIEEERSSLLRDGKVVKNFFTTAFFRKFPR